MFSLAFFSSKRRVDQDVASAVIRIFVSSSNSIVSIFFHERGQLGRCKSDSARVRELACVLFAVFSLDVMGLRESRDIIGPEFGAHDRVLI